MILEVKDAGTPALTRYQRVIVTVGTPVSGGVGGTVPPTLSLTLGAAATFGAFTPGVAQGVHGDDDGERDLLRRATRR